ncbi:MAG: T9SS type A sorting domain-containing protein [Fluviicola sp.]
MKLLVLLLGLLIGSVSWSQMMWHDLSSNPDYDSPFAPSDAIMLNGKLYQIHDSAGSYLDVSGYNNALNTWEELAHITAPSNTSGLQATQYNGKIYFATWTFDQLRMYRFDPQTNQLSPLAAQTGFVSMGSNWEFKSAGNGKMYVVNTDNGSTIYLNEYDVTSNTWSSQNVTTVVNPGNSMYYSGFQLYCSSSKVYLGLAGGVNKIGVANQGAISAFGPYNTSGSNNGSVFFNGTVPPANFSFHFTGNGQNPPVVILQDLNNNLAYEKAISTSNLNVTVGTDQPLTFQIGNSDHFMLENPAYVFMISEFASQGTANYDKFYVYRKDLGTNQWDSLGPKIEPTAPYMNANSARLSLDNGQSKHLSAFYRSTSTNGGGVIKVLNQVPFLNTPTATPNTGLCNGQNLVYNSLEIYDNDGEPVRVTSTYDFNGVLSNIQVVPVGFEVIGGVGISKFAVYADIASGGSSNLILTVNDGWSFFNISLPVQTLGVSAAPVVSFMPATPVFCNNQNIIDLTNYVSYVDQGQFTLNGNPVNGTTVNGIQLFQNSPSGVIGYRVNINGCFVNTSAVYMFATVGTATTNTTPASCGLGDGTATVSYTPGTSTIYTVEWSTGENASTITGLNPGAYYYNITDQYDCHVTGFASVGTASIDISPTVNPITCHGAQDGSISVTVAGPANYLTYWSNGAAANSITNLGPGSYWVTVVDLSNNCQVTEAFELIDPAPLTASFTTYDPDCGLSNGIIYGTYNGGLSPYTFNWIGQGQNTPNLNNVPYGYYEVQVTDQNNCSAIFGYQIDDYQAVDIQDSIIPASCNGNDGAIMINFVQDPFGGATFPQSWTWSNGNGTANNYSLQAGSYTITVASGLGWNNQMCYAQKTFQVGTKAPLRQDICVVTVDSSTTTNLVIWDKIELSGISHYKIYREDVIAGMFMWIDTVHADNLSMFNDVVASPMDRSWRYRISAVNDCGVEGPVSVAHKTLHLNTIDVQANGSVDVLWDDYEGPTSATEYVVWRKSDQNGWEALSPAVAIGTTAFNDANTTGLTGLDYYVEMVLAAPCTAQKAQDFNTTRSNKDKGAFSAGQGTGASNNQVAELQSIEMNVYPNPFTDILTVEVNEAGMNATVGIYNVNGILLKEITCEGLSTTVDLGEFAKGMYFLQIAGKEQTIPVVKQ